MTIVTASFQVGLIFFFKLGIPTDLGAFQLILMFIQFSALHKRVITRPKSLSVCLIRCSTVYLPRLAFGWRYKKIYTPFMDKFNIYLFCFLGKWKSIHLENIVQVNWFHVNLNSVPNWLKDWACLLLGIAITYTAQKLNCKFPFSDSFIEYSILWGHKTKTPEKNEAADYCLRLPWSLYVDQIGIYLSCHIRLQHNLWLA